MTAENAVVACRSCNKRRGSRPVDAYVRELRREGADVALATLRQALDRLSHSSRRTHRESAASLLRRLDSVEP